MSITQERLKFTRYESFSGTAYKCVLANGHTLVIQRTNVGKGHYPWRLEEFMPGRYDWELGERVYLGTGEYAHTKKELEARAAAYAAGDKNWWRVEA